MCNGIYTDPDTGEKQDCMVRNECYRHTATPSTWQAWGPPAPDFQASDGCDNYIPVKWQPKKLDNTIKQA